MKKLLDLQNELVINQEKLSELESTLQNMDNDNMSYFEDEITEQYNDMLNEQYQDALDSLPFYCGSAAKLYFDNDNTSYRCGLNDYADSVDVSSFQEYQDLQEEIETLESDIEDLENEIEELENEEQED